MDRNEKGFDFGGLIAAVLIMAAGTVALLFRDEAETILSIAIAGIVLFVGAMRIFDFIKQPEKPYPFSVEGLSLGLTLITLALVLFFNTQLVVPVLPVLLGSVVLFIIFGCIQTCLLLLRMGTGYWYLNAVFALILIVLGILAVVKPNLTMLFFCIDLVVGGLFQLISVFMLRHHIREHAERIRFLQ